MFPCRPQISLWCKDLALLKLRSFCLVVTNFLMSILLTLETLAIFCNVKPWGGMDSYPPYEQRLSAFFGQFFLYHPWNIYKWGAHAKNWVTCFHILVGGAPRTFIFRACLIWPSDSWQIWQNFGFVEFFSKSLSKLNQNY